MTKLEAYLKLMQNLGVLGIRNHARRLANSKNDLLRYNRGMISFPLHLFQKDNRIMAIRTGLSVTVCGVLIELKRNPKAKRAKVVLKPSKGRVLTGMEKEAVSIAAQLLAARARRFMVGWEIEEP